MSRSQILSEIAVERDLQNARFPEQRLPDGTSESYRDASDQARDDCRAAAEEDRVTWRDVLTEETMEAFAEEDSELLRAELVQVAAVAVRWIEDIDRRIA